MTEVRGLRLERDVIELKETAADGTTVVRRLPGRPLPGEVDLVRRLTDDTSFQRWMKEAHLGEGGSPRVVVSVFDPGGRRVTGYTLTGAWPRCLEIGGLTAGGATVVTETLTVAYDAMDPG